MKRIISALLCLYILISCVYTSFAESGKRTFFGVKIDAGNGAITEKAIVEDGEIYISAKKLSKYTRFSFDEKTKTFLISGQKRNKAFKYITIDVSKKRMLISGQAFFDLKNLFEIDGEIYLPFCQMLSVLNANIYEIKKDVIHVSNNALSLADVLYDFDVPYYYFNFATEFYNMNSMSLLTIVPSFLFDTVTKARFDRLDIAFNSGDFEDYKGIFANFLADNDLYLKSKAKDPSIIDHTIKFFDKSNKSVKDIKTVYDWVKTAGKSKISEKKGGLLLKSLKECYEAGDLDADDLKKLSDAWNSGKISFSSCIEIVNYAYTFSNLIEDNREMLDAVYDVNSKINFSQAERRAAKRVYDLYGEKVMPALATEVLKKLVLEVAKEINPYEVYLATAKYAGIALKPLIPFDPNEVSKLHLYSNIVLSSASKYSSSNLKTDKDTQNLRRSLLLCMIASRKCFQIMKDVFKTSDYDDKISNAERIIMGLYVSAESLKFDSFEHLEEHRENNKKAIKDSGLLDRLKEYKDFNLANTYWLMNYGQTLGSNFFARFDANGKIKAFSQAGNYEIFTGTYDYSDGKLTINFNPYITWGKEAIVFVLKGTEFQSTKMFDAQVGKQYFYIIPDKYKTYEKLLKEKPNFEKLQKVASVFPEYRFEKEKPENNGSIKPGKYKGYWVMNETGGYGYITLRKDYSFVIDTNVNHVEHKIISPVSFEGKYVVTKEEKEYPDNSKAVVNVLVLFYQNYELKFYECYNDAFMDQSSSYEYVG